MKITFKVAEYVVKDVEVTVDVNISEMNEFDVGKSLVSGCVDAVKNKIRTEFMNRNSSPAPKE